MIEKILGLFGLTTKANAVALAKEIMSEAQETYMPIIGFREQHEINKQKQKENEQ